MIQSVQPGAVGSESGASSVAGSATPAAAGGAASDATSGAGAGEAVTLSAGASATTQLLDAARGADGVDQGAVQRLRGAVQSGSYQVAPSALAKSIAGALRESAA